MHRRCAAYGAYDVGAIGEMLPNRDSRVDLDPAMRDRFGMPVARIASFVADGDVARLRFMAKTSHDLLAASGAQRIFESYSSWDRFSASHVFGSAGWETIAKRRSSMLSAAAIAGVTFGSRMPACFPPLAAAKHHP